MISNRDIIVVGLQSWDIGIGSNCKNIAIEFARHNRVLYVNSPLDRFTKWRQHQNPLVQKRIDVIKGRKEDLVQMGENIWNLTPRTLLESISRLPWNGLFDRINRVNNSRFARQIRNAADQLGFKNFILFNDSDMFRGFYLKEFLKPALSIYYSRDNLLAMDFWKVQGKRMEPAIMAKSDLVVANSAYLADRARRHNTHSYYIGQGCDLSLYDRRKIDVIPEDIAGIPGPIIGYTGVLFSLRLDMEILTRLALENPHHSLVLIGPEDDAFRSGELHRLNNVHFLGNKKPEELPAYVNRFDVAINPQKLNEITIGNYPRKIDEYLAMGKPVVATKTDAMSVFKEHVYLAEDIGDYSGLIERALRENSPERATAREDFAHSHTWENSVGQIYKLIEATI